MRFRSWLAIGSLLPTLLVAAPAQAFAPIGQGFTITPADLAYILKQIKIAEAHVAGTNSVTGPCGALLAQLGSPLLAQGLRTVDGSCNNLIPGQNSYGAADQLFPRLADASFRAAENSTTYAAKGVVYDSQPRLISNLIADQTAGNPAAVAAAGAPVRSQSGSSTPAGDGSTLFIPNVTTDVGLSAPYNSWFTLFGQFFDHGVDQTVKGGGTVIVPLRADDPLIAGPDRIPGNADDPRPGDARYVAPSMRFMVLTRAATQPGGVQEAENTDTPWVDNSQTYTSHAAHQVFLREYRRDATTTGRLLEGAAGGLPTWADVKRQAREVLGLALTDADVLAVPQVLADAYGRFVPGPARGLPQYVTATGLVEGDTANPVPIPAGALRTDAPFLGDIAHDADPSSGLRPDDDSVVSPTVAAGTYDDELLDTHFIAGDGRVNENLGLTAVHQVFHAEHNRLTGDIERVLTEDGTALADWQSFDGTWNGERIFQAARFVNEMEYQHLVFEEFARKIQPSINAFQPFAFPQTDLNPAIYAEFAHAVYRFGHSMLTETIARTREDGTDDSVSLLDGFLNPVAYTDGGTLGPEDAAAEVIRGMSGQVGNELDEFMTDTLRNNLLGLPMDLAAVNIARGRSEGVPRLNPFRRTLYAKTGDTRLKPYTSWIDFGEHLKHPESLVNFVAAYGTYPTIAAATTVAGKREAARVLIEDAPSGAAEFLNATSGSGLEDVDLWIGGLAEVTDPFGGLLGSTFGYVFENQLTRLQDGDRLYYLARTPGMNLRTQLEGNSFAELIGRTTGAGFLRADAFATSDCVFDLAQLTGTGNQVTDDPATTCDEHALLIRMPGGTIQYRARNSVDKPGLNAQSVYRGTDDPDRVVAGNDNDTIWGAEGDDVLEGGAGNDVALGGEGDDIITDSGGDDIPKGGPGNDAIAAGPGLDIVNAGTGNDFADGGANTDTVFAGEGNDLVLAGDGEDEVFGDSGDDWAEGGDGADLLQGDSGNLFFLDDSNKPGNDVLIGQGGDDDYDMEGGDDIGVQGPGIEKNAGGSGWDWSIAAAADQGGDAQPMDSDLALPLTPLGIPAIGVRDRYNEVESLSGGAGDDTLRGDDLVPANIGGGGFIGCDALDATGIARINGLDQVVTTLPTPASAVGNASGRACDLHGNVWGAGNILLGGPGNDTIEGRGGDDLIDGDRYLTVRLSVRDASGAEIRTARSLTELRPDILSGKINPNDIHVVRDIQTSPTTDHDVAVFTGPRASYTITPIAGGVLVAGPDGNDPVRNVETLEFDDESVDATGFVARPAVTAIATDAGATVLLTIPTGTAATSLTLRRAAGPTTTDTELAADVRTVDVTGLTNGVPVTFQIRINTSAGPGVFSTASDPVTPRAGATPPVATGPGIPAIGTATVGDESAVVRWTPPASDGGFPIIGYEIQAVDPATEAAVAVDAAAPDATSLTMYGLTNGVRYAFRVRAVTATGASEFSALSAPVTPGPGPSTSAPATSHPPTTQPTQPPTTQPTQPPTTQPPTTQPTQPPTTQPPTQLPTTQPTAQPTTQPTTIQPPAPTGGPTTQPTTSPPTSPPGSVPGAPALGALKSGNGTVVVRWAGPASTGGSPITRYEIEVLAAANGARTGAIRSASGTSRELTVTGLANGTAYRFRIRAWNASGAGAWSTPSAPVAPRTVPGAPTRVTARPGPRTVTISWSPPASTGGAAVTGYRVTWQPVNGAPVIVTRPASARSATLTVRGSGRVTVQAINPAGAGKGVTLVVQPR
ncbi:peroxidase family protein [Actinoplanes sp. NPDC026619]|uniref:peroxidase family protein n=1 Tax=Actinoplanes sp. NPDC026619 TaxID=3155798 RepID=UPI0033CB9344